MDIRKDIKENACKRERKDGMKEMWLLGTYVYDIILFEEWKKRIGLEIKRWNYSSTALCLDGLTERLFDRH